MSVPSGESPTTLCATTLMVYEVALTKPLSTVLVAEAGSCTGVDPPLGTLVTVYPVTGGLLADTTGGVHVTVMDEPEVAVAVTPVGGGGTAWKQDRKKIEFYNNHSLIVARISYCNAPEKSIVLEAAIELPTTLCATTLMVYVVPSCSPLSSVLVVGAVVCTDRIHHLAL